MHALLSLSILPVLFFLSPHSINASENTTGPRSRINHGHLHKQIISNNEAPLAQSIVWTEESERTYDTLLGHLEKHRDVDAILHWEKNKGFFEVNAHQITLPNLRNLIQQAASHNNPAFFSYLVKNHKNVLKKSNEEIQKASTLSRLQPRFVVSVNDHYPVYFFSLHDVLNVDGCEHLHILYTTLDDKKHLDGSRFRVTDQGLFFVDDNKNLLLCYCPEKSKL
ncbi:MAG: hypothetical protein K2X98_05955 [Alphaproteobacteria bacterium]|nr:hypothetical protein [Alphaproteobacteria bacterium]